MKTNFANNLPTEGSLQTRLQQKNEMQMYSDKQSAKAICKPICRQRLEENLCISIEVDADVSNNYSLNSIKKNI